MGNIAIMGDIGTLGIVTVVGWVLVLLGAIVLGTALSRRNAAKSSSRPMPPPERQRVSNTPTVRVPARGRGTLGAFAQQDRYQDTRQNRFPNHYPNEESDDDYDRDYDRDDRDPRKALKTDLQPAQELHGRREVLGLGAMLLGGATLWGADRQQQTNIANSVPKLPIVPVLPKGSILNLKDFGAVGDGKVDDGPALRRALDALRVQGGGVLYLPPGVFQCSAVPPTSDSTQTCCARIPSNSRIFGSGAGSTVIRLAPNSPNQAWIMSNYHWSPRIDTNISVEHLTLDGNAAKQSKKNDAQNGLVFVAATGITVHDVVFKNSYGLSSGRAGPSGTPAENFHTDCKGCSDVVYSDCRVESDPNVPCGSGYSLNGSSRVMYTNCSATGLRYGQGYTHWQSSDIMYVNCRAFGLGQDGFHSEHSDMVSYTGCFSGSAWQANKGSLQNRVMTTGTSIGFNIYYGNHVSIAQCIGRGNINYGAKIEQSSGVNIIGGSYVDNVYGLRLQDPKSVAGTTLSLRPILDNNSSGQIWYDGQVTDMSGKLNAPQMPASDHAVGNPFPFAVTVYLSGGSVSGVTLNNVAIGNPSGAITLRAGGSIKLTYSSAPTWVWLAD